MTSTASIMANPTALRRNVLRWYRTESRTFPWRYRDDPWEVLLAELLLQRTRADLVVPVYEEVLRRWPTAGQLADAAPDDVAAVLRPLGFLHRNRRVQAVAAACRAEVPHRMDDLMAIPGIGRYAATATLCFAYGRRLAVVDPTVIRFLSRLGVARSDRSRGRDDPEVWAAAQALMSKRNARTWNYAVLDLGAMVCRSTPRCGLCPLRCLCPTGQRSVRPSGQEE
jgi:A/G-specific adenine glycosylase